MMAAVWRSGVYVGLGSNLGDRLAHLRQAVAEIRQHRDMEIVRCSKAYRSPPWGNPQQPDFFNAAVELSTRLPTISLLQALLEIEARMGRARTQEKWQPRSIDIDILLDNDYVIDEGHCQVPHPHLWQRAFALMPLASLDANLVIPGRGSVDECLAALPDLEKKDIVPTAGAPNADPG